ncbi:MAG: RHS repeat-associated core domain-containing protein, partial [Thermoleophilia bacterium]
VRPLRAYNPHGDASALTDADGSVTQSYRYDAFGNELSANDTAYGYTGKWQRDYDSATGLIRMGVREYDPALGRFVSVDPLRGTPTDPQQRNRYTYTSNNPLVRYDLNGMWWGGDALGWVEDKATDFGGGVKMTVTGTWNDYQAGGFGALKDNWWQGYNSMSTTEQAILLGVPAVTAAAIIGVEAAGVGGTVITCQTLAAGASSVWGSTLGRVLDRGSKAAQGGNSAYQTALQGGRHSGTLSNYANRSTAEIEKAMTSYEHQVLLHSQKIANPASYAQQWGQMAANERAGLILKWQKDLANNQELADVMRGLLESRR